MDDIYAMELLQQRLIDASEREKKLIMDIKIAQEEREQWKYAAFVSKSRFQELDQALEDEEVKTNAERLARQEAEEMAQRHRAEVLDAKQKESIANKHCAAAESEVLRLQSELETQCSAKSNTDVVLSQLSEDLRLAEFNGNTSFGQLRVAKATISTLLEDLGVAKDHISILERQATEHEPMGEDESAFSRISHELKSLWLKFREILRTYNDIYAEHSRRTFARFVVATVLKARESLGSKQGLEQVLDIEKGIGRRAFVKATLGPGRNNLIAFPEAAVLRPGLTSVPACHVKISKAIARPPPALVVGRR